MADKIYIQLHQENRLGHKTASFYFLPIQFKKTVHNKHETSLQIQSSYRRILR